LADAELLVEGDVLPEPGLVAIEVGQDGLGPRSPALLHQAAQAAHRARRQANGLRVAPDDVLLLGPAHLGEGQAGLDVGSGSQVALDVLARASQPALQAVDREAALADPGDEGEESLVVAGEALPQRLGIGPPLSAG